MEIYIPLLIITLPVSRCSDAIGYRSTEISNSCKCPCSKLKPDAATTLKDAEKKAEKLSVELTVDKRATSAKKRKKTSAPDHRPSSQAMGAVGIIVILSVIFTIVLMDVGSFAFNIKRIRRKYSRGPSQKHSRGHSQPLPKQAKRRGENSTNTYRVPRSVSEISVLSAAGGHDSPVNTESSKICPKARSCSNLLQVPDHHVVNKDHCVDPLNASLSSIEATSMCSMRQIRVLEVQSLETGSEDDVSLRSRSHHIKESTA